MHLKESPSRIVFLLLLLGTTTPWCGPATALTAGILFSLLLGNREVLQNVGIRPLAQGVILWIVVSAAVLIAVSGGMIH